jgi:aminoglycoside 2''-phosphotransferase
VDASSARSALDEVGLLAGRITAIEGGWSYWTFEVDGLWIARFPRRDEIARASERELALLPELAPVMPFRVPEPTHVGQWQDRPFFVYPRLSGEPFAAESATPESLRELGRMLGALHSFPVTRTAELLSTGPPEHAWRRYYEQLWPLVENFALPAMPADLASQVDQGFGRFVDDIDDLPYCLVHNDLGVEHILVDPEATQPVAIIDFEEATIGDPLIDFVPVWAPVTTEGRAALLEGRDWGDRPDERLWFYRWMGSVHAIIYGVTAPNGNELRAGLDELPRRLKNRPGQ